MIGIKRWIFAQIELEHSDILDESAKDMNLVFPVTPKDKVCQSLIITHKP